MISSTIISHYYYVSLEFFPFGIGNGDNVGPRAVDESSEVIRLDVPIIFFQKAETDLYVSLIITNKLIKIETRQMKFYYYSGYIRY